MEKRQKTTNQVVVKTKSAVCEDFQDFTSRNGIREAFLYNNRLWWSKFISDEEYNINRNYVLFLKQLTK